MKTISGDTYGFHLEDDTKINYQGISYEEMSSEFRGEVIYNAETEFHFPHLTVGETLQFASLARTPRTRLAGITREQWATHMREVMMASLGLSHTVNTKVGDAYIRGVSGGERKRVSIAEAALGGSPVQCWDNSTRGLDSATALEFCNMLRRTAKTTKATMFVSLYQASQSSYDTFDKVVVLYEGRQIYFGPTADAKEFFVQMGFECPERQTTGDFLTSLTSPSERVTRRGFENMVPRTPDEFSQRWKESETFKKLEMEINEYNAEFVTGGESYNHFIDARLAKKSKHLSPKSPYTLSLKKQIDICVMRGFQRLRGDFSMAFTTVFGNTGMALIISSIFYNLENSTSSFYSRGALLFFAVLMNAFSSALEIFTLYNQRDIVEKHSRYAFYHPFCEAASSMICDFPTKVVTAIMFNLSLYFMSNLRRSPGHFFIFFLFSFLTTMTMSSIFRTIASFTKTIEQAMPFASLLILALVIYTGFAIPIKNMHPWFRWINYINPIGYGFETLMVNEFDGRKFPCSVYIPSGTGYSSVPTDAISCSTVGAISGESFVRGERYIEMSFKYYPKHMWRNIGIIIAFFIFFTAVYLIGVEYVSGSKSKGEILIFKRNDLQKSNKINDIESNNAGEKAIIDGDINSDTKNGILNLAQQKGLFQWKGVTYDIKIKGEPRRILDGVDGWVQPGKLTALMGATGAGKTTLLDVLAYRVTMGVVAGDMLVNGHPRDGSFQRKTGYVQQQDLHLSTSTVREALTFSALLRQPKSIPREEKISYVDEVIRILEMEAYSEAVVGIPGEGLNVEQRKKLTIGVELAAKPELLLFLDEPTSGLDSQTAWSICTLMRKLANNGQAILCTIHQPSAMLFQQFDRLLFLQKGGQTVYYGDIGENSRTLIDYFERYDADPCPPDANPAEWMLEVIGAAPGSKAKYDYHQVWIQSPEHEELQTKLDSMANRLILEHTSDTVGREMREPYAASFYEQFRIVYKRIWQQYWRDPTYIWSKFFLCDITTLFIGFSFWKAGTSQQGLQNQMFAVFMSTTSFGSLVQQIMPNFVTQRSLYEVREGPSKTYSWQVFMLSNIFLEIPWEFLMSVGAFFCFYYPIGLQNNTTYTDSTSERGALFFLYIVSFYIFTCTFAHMIIAGMSDADTASNIANILFSFTLLFCGVMATPDNMPHFWIFMYRVSPFTYYISGLLSTALANAPVVCSKTEFVNLEPPNNLTCYQYMEPYMSVAGGYLQSPNATSECEFCSYSSTNSYLSLLEISYGDRWRNFGLMIVYIIFNVFGALALYWLCRVPKKSKKD